MYNKILRIKLSIVDLFYKNLTVKVRLKSLMRLYKIQNMRNTNSEQERT